MQGTDACTSANCRFAAPRCRGVQASGARARFPCVKGNERCRAPTRAQVQNARYAAHRRKRVQASGARARFPCVGPSAWRQPRCRQPKQYHVRECASSGTAEVTSSYHCLEKSILPSDSPVGSTPIGDLSVVRVLRVCGWLYGRRRPVHATPGRARGRRRWKLAECDAKERRRSNCPALLCLFGVIAFASELVGVWMSTLDESQPPGAARHDHRVSLP